MKTHCFELPVLTPWHKKRMLRWAEQVLTMHQQMLREDGGNIIHYTLGNIDTSKHIRLAHYPKGDRIDFTTGAQYFYHCHRENYNEAEHGHFHCFLRQKYIQKSIKPTPLPDWDIYQKNPLVHLITIGMNQFGQPVRLFTVNRWVTAETWHDAIHYPKFIKRFKMTLTDDPYWQILDRWIEGILNLFAPQIEWLCQMRDIAMADYYQQNPTKNHYEDRTIEELSQIKIDLNLQVNWILS